MRLLCCILVKNLLLLNASFNSYHSDIKLIRLYVVHKPLDYSHNEAHETGSVGTWKIEVGSPSVLCHCN